MRLPERFIQRTMTALFFLLVLLLMVGWFVLIGLVIWWPISYLSG